MKAIAYKNPSIKLDSYSLEDINLPKPVPNGRDILVKIEAVSVNPVDTKIRSREKPTIGEYRILGWDAAGVVDSIGNEVSFFSPGDKVWYAGAINRQGTDAEYHLVDERIVSHMPTSLDFSEAAALPLTSITAWELLFDRFQLSKKSKGKLLIIGAGGGVGSILIQLAKKLTNLTVIASASRVETKEWVTSLGADFTIDHHTSIVSGMNQIGINNVNYIAGLTKTKNHFSEISEIITPQGHLGVIDDLSDCDLMQLKRKSISIHWEFMFTRSLFTTDDMIQQHEILSKVAKMVDEGDIKSTMTLHMGKINSTNLINAHRISESGKGKGKIVLSGF